MMKTLIHKDICSDSSEGNTSAFVFKLANFFFLYVFLLLDKMILLEYTVSDSVHSNMQTLTIHHKCADNLV